MLVLTIVFGASTIIFAVLFILQTIQNKQLSRKLQKRNDERRTQPVTMSFPTKSNEELVKEINRLLHAKETQSQHYRVSELKLQEAISNVSHDMRTPLTAILGYLHLVNQGDPLDLERSNYLQIIESRARSLQRLIEDFYDLSRLDENEYQFDYTWVDVNHMCLELIATHYDDFVNAELSVDIELLAKAPKVLADEKAVSRIFNNVFSNVIRHGVDKLIVSSKVENNQLIVAVKNKSTVMTKSEIEQLFERSYTLSSSRNNESTGLGLAICKTLLNKMGHEIKAAYHEGFFSISIIYNLENEERYSEKE